MTQQRQARIHAQTLAELNYCVSTARRDAAYKCLIELASLDTWPGSRSERAVIYQKCLHLAKEALDTTTRSSLMYCNPKQGLWDKPIIHFLKMIQQLLQTLNFMAEHVESVQNEAEVLEEHLGNDTFSLLKDTCDVFEDHEKRVQVVMKSTLNVGQNLIAAYSTRRYETFSEDDKRRYDKAFKEYLEHYKN